MLQCFGAARELELLKLFEPTLTTSEVEKEQMRTAPLHAQDQFKAARKAGWLKIHPPPDLAAVREIRDQNPALSRTDAELLVLAMTTGEDLFTDEKELLGAAKARGVTAYNVTTTILMLEELGLIDAKRKLTLVASIHMEDGKVFKPPELDALGLKGLF